MPPSTSALALSHPDTPAPVAAVGPRPRRSVPRALAAGWGVLGQLALVAVPAALLLRAAVRGLADGDVGPGPWALAAATAVFLGYFQGYRGFHRRYAPYVAARAAHLAHHATAWHGLAAPLHVCGLVGATARRRARAALVLAVMPLLALAVRRLPATYRAVVDLGVALGLACGALSIAYHAARAAAGRRPSVPLDLPRSSR